MRWTNDPPLLPLLPTVLTLSALTTAIPLDPNNHDSILAATATAAYNLQLLYTGNQTTVPNAVLGKFPYPPYFWWLSGAAWGAMVEYTNYTGDDSYAHVTYDALVSQISPTGNYLPEAEMYDEGNDDIAFWAFAALSAAEHSWREPPEPYPTWRGICDNIFNDFVDRWYDADATCGGGLKWQVFPSSNGYDYKNAISNGGFLQLAARLYRLSLGDDTGVGGGNETYRVWAEKVWQWSVDVGFIAPAEDNGEDTATAGLVVYDGAGEDVNCTTLDGHQWSYNPAVYLYGAAVMADVTGEQAWFDRTIDLLAGLGAFVSPFGNATDVLYERECELDWDCNIDQVSFKGYLARWLAQTAVLVPVTAERIREVLTASATAAARSCVGGEQGSTCGVRWYLGTWDGTSGLGQALSALEVLTSLLVMS